jgi:small subunit ribosomal protein S6
MALYEAVFITRQDLTVTDVDNLADKLAKIITEKEGKIISKEYWGLRSLAYKIKKNSRGHYVLLNIEAPFEAVAEMKRVISFNEDIIRSDIFNVEKHAEHTSQLMFSANAKDYKAGKTAAAPTAMDAVIDQIIINN